MDGRIVSFPSNRRLLWVALLLALLMFVGTLAIPGSSTLNHNPFSLSSVGTRGQHFPLEISPDPISLGVVDTGQKARGSLTLVNHGSQPVRVERIESSCPCLAITPHLIRIGPHEKKVLTVEFDGSVEPDFHGGLAIDVTGYAAERVAFHTVAKLEIHQDSHEEVGGLVPIPLN